MKKRFLSLVCALVMLLSFAACGQSADSGAPAADAPVASAAAPAAEGEAAGAGAGPLLELPLTAEEVTFTMFTVGIDNLLSSFAVEDNDFSKRILDDTGIRLEFIASTAADRKDKLSVLLNSGDYPDLVRDIDMPVSDVQYYGSQGIFIPIADSALTDYPNMKAMAEQFAVNDVLRSSDGNLYMLPEVNDALHNTYRGGRMHYYMPWFRDNGRELPKTLDEFTEFLRWVKTGDPNGNGQADEIPFAFFNNEATVKNAISALAKPFMPWVMTDRDWGLAVIDGKVTEQYRQEEFREALRYMNMLYSEGLILENSFSITQDELRAIGSSEEGATIGIVAGFGADVAVQRGTPRWAEYHFIMPPLEGANGDKWAPNKDPWNMIIPGLMITDKCSDPDLVYALYNYLLDFEVSMDGYIGPKGEAWDDPDPGALSLRGDPARYKLLTNWGTQRENSGWNQKNPMFRNSDFRLGEQAIDYEIAEEWLTTGNPDLLENVYQNPSFNEIANYNTALPLMEFALPDEMFLPPMPLDEADSARVADIKAVLDPFKLQAFAEFITGARSVDTDWDAYIAELDAMATAEMIEIYQRNYDAR